DLMRAFQKIFRKSGIPIAYSGGFSPHQVFSIAAPLPVGMTSEGEYLDLKLETTYDLEKLLTAIQGSCPKGLIIQSVVVLDEEEIPAMAAVSAAKYRIHQREPFFTAEKISDFASRDSIVIRKKTKKGLWLDFDIKPGILQITPTTDNNVLMTLASGSVLNIKPEAVFEAYCEFIGQSYEPRNFLIHRLELYHGDTDLIPLSTPIKEVF
ncbi:MAG: DUF2344 domain-containing protein, partial [Vallitaleaceae bacterium]|nr:DUF2344 domain-containing protein [Vallitaleaceae bacterium]